VQQTQSLVPEMSGRTVALCSASSVVDMRAACNTENHKPTPMGDLGRMGGAAAALHWRARRWTYALCNSVWCDVLVAECACSCWLSLSRRLTAVLAEMHRAG